MNFWKYTFNGKFMFYAAVAWMAAIVVMLIFYIAGNKSGVLITLFTQSTLFKIGITWQYILYKRYKRFVMDTYKKIM